MPFTPTSERNSGRRFFTTSGLSWGGVLRPFLFATATWPNAARSLSPPPPKKKPNISSLPVAQARMRVPRTSRAGTVAQKDKVHGMLRGSRSIVSFPHVCFKLFVTSLSRCAQHTEIMEPKASHTVCPFFNQQLDSSGHFRPMLFAMSCAAYHAPHLARCVYTKLGRVLRAAGHSWGQRVARFRNTLLQLRQFRSRLPKCCSQVRQLWPNNLQLGRCSPMEQHVNSCRVTSCSSTMLSTMVGVSAARYTTKPEHFSGHAVRVVPVVTLVRRRTCCFGVHRCGRSGVMLPCSRSVASGRGRSSAAFQCFVFETGDTVARVHNGFRTAWQKERCSRVSHTCPEP